MREGWNVVFQGVPVMMSVDRATFPYFIIKVRCKTCKRPTGAPGQCFDCHRLSEWLWTGGAVGSGGICSWMVMRQRVGSWLKPLCKFSNLTISLLILFWIINGFVYCLGSYILIDCRLTVSHETIYQLYLLIKTCSAYEKWRTICSAIPPFYQRRIIVLQTGSR